MGILHSPENQRHTANAVSSRAGMVQQEEGNMYYKQIVSGPSGGVFKFAEAWSSQRTLYKHLLQSPTVQRVFRGDLLKALAYPNITVEPNWRVSAPQFQSSAHCTRIFCALPRILRPRCHPKQVLHKLVVAC